MSVNDGDAIMEVKNSRFWNNTITGHGVLLAAGGSGCCAETAVIKVSNVATQDISIKTEVIQDHEIAVVFHLYHLRGIFLNEPIVQEKCTDVIQRIETNLQQMHPTDTCRRPLLVLQDSLSTVSDKSIQFTLEGPFRRIGNRLSKACGCRVEFFVVGIHHANRRGNGLIDN